ncbi:MAG: beta galactosidase jelly roll domain-containing protein [Prolixibacteraceae bacterium]|jgi:hypothetical protein|nr:beta galactosidase jelly roll domain-containing protein [Prolixibacteraceae bacterium]
MISLFKSINKNIFKFAIFIVVLSTISCSQQVEILAPTNGTTLNNNMPTFSWTPVECDYYEIWINSIKMDEVPADRNVYTPFNLSFGTNSWQVIGVSENKNSESEIATFTIDDSPLTGLPESAILLRNNWKIKSSLLVNENGEALTTSTSNFNEWYSTSLPSTALSALVRNGVYPNPYISLNNLLIPDASDSFNVHNDLLKYSHIEGKNPWKTKFWYRTEFSVAPEKLSKKAYLNLEEINYRAEVWLNGRLVADSSQLVGMERYFKLNVTGTLAEKNQLAIAIYPPDPIGTPATPPVEPLAHPGRNLGQDAMITKDYTKWDVLGWDWQPGVRDRDMGITEDVYLSFTDDIEVSNLYVSSNLPLPDTSSAEITISADIENKTELSKEGILSASISYENEIIEFKKEFKVEPGKTKSISWDKKDFDELIISNPKLWWPFGYGNQNLYKLELTAKTHDGDVSKISSNFGIREVETYIGSNERVYKINGEEVYMKGGNWVIDMMLNWTASRYDHEIRLTKASGLNMLRVWGPTGAPPKAFYDAADKHGVLIWQDFLNDFWGTFLNNPEFTPSVELFQASSIDIIKKYRNHPSLVMWCGGNEGPNPKEKLIMEELLPTYDGRDSKHYLKISNADGIHGGGPYHVLEPKGYFTARQLQGFSSELGPSGVPEFESMEKFMYQMGEDWKPGQFPLNSEWTYHDATDRFFSDQRKFSHFDKLVRDFYGAPDSTSAEGFKDYVKKSQVVSYEAYRSCIEAINCQLWENSSGYALWKSNSSWPSVVWQVYDWYLQTHSGFYATQLANEMVHIQLNRETMKVDVLNATRNAIDKLKLSAQLYNSDIEEIWIEEKKVSLAKNSVFKTGWEVPENDEINYLVLKIEDENGKLISRNFYWLNSTNNFKALNTLDEAEIKATVLSISETEAVITLTNHGANLAFMVDLKLEGKHSGNELLPSYWNTNYFSLLPGESIKARVAIDSIDLTEEAVIKVNAYNLKQKITLEF